MKLIIDIPKDVYEDILKHSTEIQAEGYVIKIAVLHGTPLDDVKEEIEQDMSFDMFDDYGNKTRIHKELWEILDNIGKAESEDKE